MIWFEKRMMRRDLSYSDVQFRSLLVEVASYFRMRKTDPDSVTLGQQFLK